MTPEVDPRLYDLAVKLTAERSALNPTQSMWGQSKQLAQIWQDDMVKFFREQK